MTSTEATTKIPKGRSPSYPGVSLPTALDRARAIWDKYRGFEQPIDNITSLWGYKSSTTGPASVTFAALRKYGLLEAEGQGKARVAKLSPLAIDIINKPSPQAEIEYAALLPTIHSEMWSRFGAEVPDADVLHYEFVIQRGFTDTGLKDFLREYRETIAFAKPTSSGTVGGQTSTGVTEELDDDHDQPDDDHDDPDRRKRVRKPAGPGVLTYAVPVAAGEDVTIEGRFPMTEAEWSQFMAVLTAMKPALVAEPILEPTRFGDEDE